MTADLTNRPRTAAQLLVAQLKAHGVDMVFCVPGESYLPVLDALYDTPEIRVITCRQEGGAAMMAEAHGKLTGRPGVAFVTRGPGATNASAGVHVAHQDSTPLILFIGQVDRATTERGAFQEIDYRAMYGPLTKWATQIDNGNRVPEVVGRAFHLATSGRPGPVVIALPEDMLSEAIEATAAQAYATIKPALSEGASREVAGLLAMAKRPLVIAGGTWNAEAALHAAAFAERWQLPIAVAYRCQDYVRNDSLSYVGNLGGAANPALMAAVREADVILAVGTRLGEITSSSYTLLAIPDPAQKLIHIHPDSDELGRVYRPILGAVSSSEAAFARLSTENPPSSPVWADNTARLRQTYLDWTTPFNVIGDVQLGEIFLYLRCRLPLESIVTNGAGNFSLWPNRFLRFQQFRGMLGPQSGSMGYGIPAAVTAKLVHPHKLVVAFTGDGDMLMTGQELATAVQENAPIVIVLLNNGMYGTIRAHQERHYPGRVIGTSLKNPDFARFAEAFGAIGARITRTEEFADAFERAVASGKSALLDVIIDPELLSPNDTIASLRARHENH